MKLVSQVQPNVHRIEIISIDFKDEIWGVQKRIVRKENSSHPYFWMNKATKFWLVLLERPQQDLSNKTNQNLLAFLVQKWEPAQVEMFLDTPYLIEVKLVYQQRINKAKIGQ